MADNFIKQCYCIACVEAIVQHVCRTKMHCAEQDYLYLCVLFEGDMPYADMTTDEVKQLVLSGGALGNPPNTADMM